MNTTVQEEYDRVLYPGAAFSQTHPDRLAVMARIFGLQPAPIEHCRVLEIGCTDGGNLIPMAYSLPEATFVGIDISTRSVAIGRECIESLGLTNIRLLEMDILHVPEDFGTFDYIIAHGVYSWVPNTVREKVLALCRTHLAPQGVAYISYNTYPGCHFRDLVRGMMRFHVRNIEDPDEKRRQAAGLLHFVMDSQRPDDLFAKVVGQELERIEKATPAAFYHDDLAETRTPFYFHEFVKDAAQNGLQFLSEASYWEMQEQIFPPNTVKALQSLGNDRLTREQYLDFLKCRRFRQSLLCQREAKLAGPQASGLRDCYFTSRARSLAETPSLADGVAEEFSAPGDASVKTGSALTKAAIHYLAERWPHSVAFEELLEAASAKIGKPLTSETREARSRELSEILLALYAGPIIQIHAHQPRFTLQPSERPAVSAVARWGLTRGINSVTNLCHQTTRIEDPIAYQLMLLLDGTRDRAAIHRDLTHFCETNQIPADSQTISANLESSLLKLANMAMFVS